MHPWCLPVCLYSAAVINALMALKTPTPWRWFFLFLATFAALIGSYGVYVERLIRKHKR